MDELLRAFMQQVEIDEQVIIYLEMTQVRRVRGIGWGLLWGTKPQGGLRAVNPQPWLPHPLPAVPQRPAAGRLVPALHLHQLQQRLPPLPPGDEVHVPR